MTRAVDQERGDDQQLEPIRISVELPDDVDLAGVGSRVAGFEPVGQKSRRTEQHGLTVNPPGLSLGIVPEKLLVCQQMIRIIEQKDAVHRVAARVVSRFPAGFFEAAFRSV